MAVEPKRRARVSKAGALVEHPFQAVSAQMMETTERWEAANTALLSEVRDTNKHLGSVADSLNLIASFMKATGHFAKKWGPWIIAAAGTWLGWSPTLIKALIAATGH